MKNDDSQQGNDVIGSTDVVTRRQFLRTAGVAMLGTTAAVGLSGPTLSHAKSTAASRRSGRVPLIEGTQASALQGAVADLETKMTRRLHLVNEHTGDDFNVVFYTHGIYLNDNVSMLNHLMRDRRANLATQMDTTLYNQLFLLRSILGTEEPIHILSGYRTPETNAKLRSRSKRVAKYSLHIEGRAADIYIPGYSAKKIQKAALTMQAGGVGLYSKSNFVHIDTGQVRHWGG
ncbi:MAG: YcbK family protein [Granulosicoccus sp.]